MKILVVGATGSIGRLVLEEANDRVRELTAGLGAHSVLECVGQA